MGFDRYAQIFTFAAVAAGLVGACSNRPSGLKNVGPLIEATLRTGGGTILEFEFEDGKRATKAVEFRFADYPIDAGTDDGFVPNARLAGWLKVGAGQIASTRSLQVRCGYLVDRGDDEPAEHARITRVVLWSGAFWDGQKREIACGGGEPPTLEAYQASAPDLLGFSIGSICLVHDDQNPKRINRCRQGPRCDDGLKNGSESAIDCGGDCDRCAPGKACSAASDCRSGVCTGGTCRAPSCSDGVKNGQESDRDCSGACAPCDIDEACGGDGDCATDRCRGGRCEARPRISGCAGASSCLSVPVEECADREGCMATGFGDARTCGQARGAQVYPCNHYGSQSACEAQAGCDWW